MWRYRTQRHLHFLDACIGTGSRRDRVALVGRVIRSVFAHAKFEVKATVLIIREMQIKTTMRYHRSHRYHIGQNGYH